MKANGYYNGFGPADREGTLDTVRQAIADGLLAPPEQCSICGQRPTKPLQWHSEDYRRPLEAHPVCRGCHIRVHARFRHPDRWRAHISRLDPTGWFQMLSIDTKSLTQPFDETYPVRQPSSLPRIKPVTLSPKRG